MITNIQFRNISASRKEKTNISIEAKNNLKITKIANQNIDAIAKNQGASQIEFTFLVEYSPDFAKIELSGVAIYINTMEKISNLVKKWEKEKKIGQEFVPPIFNHILAKCTTKALSIEEELDLPFHIPLPKVKPKTQEPLTAS